jgi:hypothetical protein
VALARARRWWCRSLPSEIESERGVEAIGIGYLCRAVSAEDDAAAAARGGEGLTMPGLALMEDAAL